MPAGPLTVLTEPRPLSTERSVRKRHPFGSLGVALVAGIALAAAKSLADNHWGALKRRLT